ncbi:MAG: hypothetical protein SVW57_09625 [Thermodesulfobacteriota bacterium]|nr:hypothetical protein [Thermodesulfobacteriota bacterium]
MNFKTFSKRLIHGRGGEGSLYQNQYKYHHTVHMKGGVKEMKKLMFMTMIGFIAVALVVLYGSPAFAVNGQCSNCHTMHNSQDGAPMNFDASATPNPVLLRGDCIGCHSVTDTSNFNSVNAPAVLNTVEPTAGVLAGGNFYWVDNGTDNLGHNVDFLQGKDAQFAADPPGWDSTYRASASDWAGNQLTCAGVYGCHGDPTVTGSYEGVKGAHHSNATGSITGNPATTGASYRFLYGIAGVEDSDYEATVGIADKNMYQGANNVDTATNTMSYLCATCHGVFHDKAEVGSTSPFIRHPNDYLLPETSEYGNYNPITTYVNEAPVAWITPGTPARAEAVVMCLSCHRAHGMGDVDGAQDAQFADILRFEYDDMVAGGGVENAGCLTCHNTKD